MDSKTETLLLKIRKGSDAIKNAKNLKAVISVLPNWSIEDVTVFIEPKYEPPYSIITENNLPNFLNYHSDNVNTSDEYEAEIKKAHEVFKSLVVSELPESVKRDAYFITSVGELVERSNDYYNDFKFDYSTVYGSKGFLITAPNGETFELGKEPSRKGYSFYKLVIWAVENGLKEDVCNVLGLDEYRNAKEQKQHEFTKRYISADEVKPVVELLDKVVVEYHEGFVDLIKTSLEAQWENLKKSVDEHNAKSRYKRKVETKEHYVNRFLNNAVKSVEEKWKYKILSKVAVIIVDKGNLKKIEASNVSLQGNVSSTLKVSFEDGSEFYVDTSVEYSYSVNGVFFARYPLRFTNVKFSDGTYLKQPSEEKLNKEFIKS